MVVVSVVGFSLLFAKGPAPTPCGAGPRLGVLGERADRADPIPGDHHATAFGAARMLTHRHARSSPHMQPRDLRRGRPLPRRTAS